MSGDIVAGAIISHTRASRSSFRELTTEESTMRSEVYIYICVCNIFELCKVHTFFTSMNVV